jgi:hypothetical protein
MQWRVLLSDLSVWAATDHLLRDLLNFSFQCAVRDFTINQDRQQVENWATAWRSLAPSRKPRNVLGPIAIINGSFTVADWRSVLSKLTAKAAAETIVGNFLFDPSCGYDDGVAVLARAMEAWADIAVRDHIGIGLAPEPPPQAA